MKKGILAEEIEGYVQSIQGFLKYDRECAIADDVIETFENVRGSVSSYGGVTLEIRDILKMSDATDILRYLASTHDVHVQGEPEKMSYTAGWRWRFSDTMKLSALFKNAPEATCRMVKVGTKTVEQDILEMQCDENGNGEPADDPSEVEPVESLEPVEAVDLNPVESEEPASSIEHS